MEKMLVCDYDDTVMTSNHYITYLNVESLKKFKANGNKLVFASGRDFNSLKYELVKLSCPYDALICNDGSVGFDSRDQIIYKNTFNKYEMEDLLYYFEHYIKNIIHGYDLYDTFGYTTEPNDIVQISILPKLFKKTNTIPKDLKEFFSNYKIYKNVYRYQIRKNCTKSDGIKRINEIFNMGKNNIYTVGDWVNDYEMIQDYNGYNVLISHPSLYKISKGTVLNTVQLVKKLENK